MDNAPANPTGRKFPAYTTAELERSISEGVTAWRTEAQLNEMKLEVSRRHAGLSKTMHEILNGARK